MKELEIKETENKEVEALAQSQEKVTEKNDRGFSKF